MTWLLRHWTEYTEFPAAQIARALGALNRYGGQYPEGGKPLSVARHSVLVYRLLGDDEPQVGLAALVHDVHECWTGDLLRPFLADLSPTSRIEVSAIQNDIDWFVYNRMLEIECTADEWQRVKAADDAACKAELAYLDCPETCPDPIISEAFESTQLWSPRYDAALWLRVFEMVRKELAAA